jgi:cellulase/cellobiase CelA1
MEQVEGGDLIVNSGKQSRPKDVPDGARELNAVESYEAAHKLAQVMTVASAIHSRLTREQANLDELIKENVDPPSHNPSSPVTYSHIYIRVQPFMTAFSLPDQQPGSKQTAAAATQSHLQFMLHLSDPAHNLTHTTVTQAVPGKWMELWDQYDWVEDLVAEALRVGVEVLGQDYIVARMGWGNKEKEAEKASEEDNDYSIVNEKVGEA